MDGVTAPTSTMNVLQPVKATEPTLFWLGAGFSRCVNPVAPLMNDFFVGFDGSKFPHLAKYLSLRHGGLDGVNVEDVLLAIDQIGNCPLPPRVRAEMMYGQDPQKIKWELERFCLERLSYDVPDLTHWAVQLLAAANEKTTVVTTNYDVLAEQVLRRRAAAAHCTLDATCHHCNMRTILEDKCACGDAGVSEALPRNAALLKIHGSIAWRTCRNKACGITECLKSTCDCTVVHEAKCECCGEEADPVIILPSAHKSFERYPQLVRMWSLAHQGLSDAVAITIFGFSFPVTDTLIRDLFRSAIAKRRSLREIFIIDVFPETVWKRIESIMPDGLDPAVHLLDVPLDGSVPTWMNPDAV